MFRCSTIQVLNYHNDKLEQVLYSSITYYRSKRLCTIESQYRRRDVHLYNKQREERRGGSACAKHFLQYYCEARLSFFSSLSVEAYVASAKGDYRAAIHRKQYVYRVAFVVSFLVVHEGGAVFELRSGCGGFVDDVRVASVSAQHRQQFGVGKVLAILRRRVDRAEEAVGVDSESECERRDGSERGGDIVWSGFASF